MQDFIPERSEIKYDGEKFVLDTQFPIAEAQALPTNSASKQAALAGISQHSALDQHGIEEADELTFCVPETELQQVNAERSIKCLKSRPSVPRPPTEHRLFTHNLKPANHFCDAFRLVSWRGECCSEPAR